MAVMQRCDSCGGQKPSVRVRVELDWRNIPECTPVKQCDGCWATFTEPWGKPQLESA